METKISSNDLISTREAAKILGVSPSTLKSWREHKLFGVPFFPADEQRGKTWYYLRERVEQLKILHFKGVLKVIYQLSRTNSENTPTGDFKNLCNPGGNVHAKKSTNWTLSENTPAGDFQKVDMSSGSWKKSTNWTLSENTPAGDFQNPVSTRHSPPSDDEIFAEKEVSNFLGVPITIFQDLNKTKKLQPFIIDHNGDFYYTRKQIVTLQNLFRCDKPIEELSGGQPISEFLVSPKHRVINCFNVQVHPSKRIFFPNDRLSKVLFNLTEESFRDMVEGKRTHNLVEVRNHRRFGKIVSPYRLFADESAEFLISEPADQMDFAVLCVCISELKAGNFFTTPAIIYRGLTGKVDKGTSAMPSVDQLNAIMNSIDKLMSLRVDITMKDYCENFGCNDGKSFRLVSNLLPCEYSTKTTINGKSSTIIHFLDQSPLWKIAELKNRQYLSFPAEYLNVPNQHNTPLNVGIKHYVLRRVMESIAHSKQMTRTITFDDVVKKCRLNDVNREKKSAVRKVICDLFRHLKNCEAIDSYIINRKYNFFHSIFFEFDTK